MLSRSGGSRTKTCKTSVKADGKGHKEFQAASIVSIRDLGRA
ncbi:hypothetical protein AB0C21_10595 [Spirillospora sp. NPDC049024]